MQFRSTLIALAIACSFPAARAQLIVSSNVGTGGNVPQGYTWYIDLATGERTILFKGGFNAIGVDDAKGKVYLAGGPLYVWNYGSSTPPQLLGPVRNANGQLVIMDALAFGGGALFGAAAVNQPIGLYRIDLTAMIATKIVLTSAPSGAPEGLAFNPADGMFYGVKDDDYSNQPGIYRYDLLGSGAVTFAAPLPPLPTYDTDGLAVGNGRAYVITDSHSPFAVWDFATRSYLANTMTSPFVVESYFSGGSGTNPSLVAGQTVWMQCLSRDPGTTAVNGLGLSPALHVTIQP